MLATELKEIASVFGEWASQRTWYAASILLGTAASTSNWGWTALWRRTDKRRVPPVEWPTRIIRRPWTLKSATDLEIASANAPPSKGGVLPIS